MNNDTPITSAAWNAAKEQTDTNDNPDWGCVAHDMRDKCAELERDVADQARWAKHYLDALERAQSENARLRDALQAVRDWHDRDGSVGGCSAMMEESVEPFTVSSPANLSTLNEKPDGYGRWLQRLVRP